MAESDNSEAAPLPVYKVKHGDKVYVLDESDMDGLERRAFRQSVGYSLRPALTLARVGQLDEYEFLAGVIWIVRRREEQDLLYDDVLRSVTAATVTIAEDSEETPPED